MSRNDLLDNLERPLRSLEATIDGRERAKLYCSRIGLERGTTLADRRVLGGELRYS
jgi:hypothetical protein